MDQQKWLARQAAIVKMKDQGGRQSEDLTEAVLSDKADKGTTSGESRVAAQDSAEAAEARRIAEIASAKEADAQRTADEAAAVEAARVEAERRAAEEAAADGRGKARRREGI